jgi:hypothetical protein
MPDLDISSIGNLQNSATSDQLSASQQSLIENMKGFESRSAQLKNVQLGFEANKLELETLNGMVMNQVDSHTKAVNAAHNAAKEIRY